MVQLKGNYIFVNPGEKSFLAASNWVNYIELGDPHSDGSFFLVAEIQHDRFVVSARLFDEKGKRLAEVRSNNIVTSGAAVRYAKEGGYEIVDQADRMILRLKLIDANGSVCLIQGKFFDERGRLVAEGGEDDFRIYSPPAVLGRSGGSRGIVLREPTAPAAE